MDFQKKVMRKVYWIWFTRRVLPIAVFEVFSVMLGLHLFSRSVYVVRVLQSTAAAATGGKRHFISFLWSAFLNTRFEVKMEMAIAVVFTGLFLWSVKRAIVSYEVLRRTASFAGSEQKSSQHEQGNGK